MYTVDLNSDIGESFGAWKMGMDEKVIPYISSANIACGFHAGDPVVLEKTLGIAKTAGIGVGAHPGYPDVMGFGRRNMAASPSEVKAYVKYQLGAFYAFAKTAGMEVQHLKAHGAMYNTAGKDIRMAEAIVSAVREFDSEIIILALAGSKMTEAAEAAGLRYASEVFADRGYEEDGSLVARNKPGAIITDEDEAINRIVRMITEGKVEAVTGRDISLRCESICVHGDGEKALAFVQKIRTSLGERGIKIASLADFIR